MVRTWNILKDYLVVIIAAAFFAIFVRFFVIEAFRIPADLMSPGLLGGDHIFVNKLSYGFRYPSSGFASTELSMPQRGDVVVFTLYSDPSKDYIKRVVGIAGDKVEIKDSILSVNDKPVSQLVESRGDIKIFQEELNDHRYQVQWQGTANLAPLTIPENQIFVLGDNRSKGSDSRQWGFVPLASIKGRAWFIWFSIGKVEAAKEQRHIQWSRFFKKVE